MNEPQVWTVIGVLAAAFFGGLTVITQLILRTLSAPKQRKRRAGDTVALRLHSATD